RNMFCPENGVCKYGFLIKSPPLQLFTSQNSWKRRFFILSKSSKGNYILKYLKGQNVKGSIAVDQIANIEVGIRSSEIMETVRKMFKCLPEQVMSISTGNRCYYLIGSSRQETEDWVSVISSVCKEAKRALLLTQSSCSQLFFSSHKTVSSWPSWRKLNAGEAPAESGSSEDKNRPTSDPGPHQAQCDSPRGVSPSVDEEDYYQTPSSILAKVVYPFGQEKPSEWLFDPTANTARMPGTVKPVHFLSPFLFSKLLDESCQLTCRHGGLPSPPKCQDNSVYPRDLEANRDLKFPESSTSQQPTLLLRRQNSLPLSVVQLCKLVGQVTDETQLQKLDIFVPLADINSYLKLTEAAGKI
ncbi:Pleckstrin homology domain-containing family S member 1, partial [Buceros rhinoceros silvestris]